MTDAPVLAAEPDDWTAHDGGACPIDSSAMIVILYRNGNVIGPVPASSRRWKRWPAEIEMSDWDIEAFQVVGQG